MNTVLVIDDDVQCLRATARLLSADFSVTTAARANQAVALVQSGRQFDVILCDLSLDGTTGREVYERIRASDPEQAARVIFMSGLEPSDPLFEGRFLLKPIPIDVLRSRVGIVARKAA